MSQKRFNSIACAISVVVAFLVLLDSMTFKSRIWGELSLAFFALIIAERHASHKTEIEKIKKQNRKFICSLEERRLSLEIQLERFSKDEPEFKLFLESEIASLRKIISKYEDT